jgi:hypothetical protein
MTVCAVNRRAVLVLGMHRSGTSALAGLLMRLGVAGPRTPMQPGDDNPLGYGESKAFHEFHERLLQSLGSSWDAWSRVSPDWFASPDAIDRAEEFRALLEQEFADASLFVVKDPRICRLLPFWLRNLAANDIGTVAVIMVRSPLEVAASLKARNALGRDQALLIWLRHVLDAELGTRTTRRSVIGYADLLNDWRSVAAKISAEIGVEWQQGWADAEEAISEFLRPELRHHTIELDRMDAGLPLSSWVADTYGALQLLVRGRNRAKAITTLDRVRQALDHFSSRPPVAG